MLTRTEIVHEGKQLVIQHGPNNVIEFGGQLLESYGTDPDSPDGRLILAEALHQAVRVCRFLGFEPYMDPTEQIAALRRVDTEEA